MFECIKEIDGKIYSRYVTLIRNIKARSNSFYDAFLDLQEEFVKFVCNDNNLDLSVRETCGEILKRTDVVDLFLLDLKLDKHYYDKMKDYTLKVNHHKHRNEKYIQIDTILNYMTVFYNVFKSYCDYKNIIIEDLDLNYFVDIFGVYEKENVALKMEMESLKDELKTSIKEHKIKDSDILVYQNICNKVQNENISLEEQNEELHKQISKLKDIKLSSMEDKLNKTIELLLNLKDAIIENRVISYALGDSIEGRESLKKRIDKAKEEWNL